jgi:hypothetical protein
MTKSGNFLRLHRVIRGKTEVGADDRRQGETRLRFPHFASKQKGNIIGWLNTDVSGSDKRGEAAVRDADESIEIMLVQEKNGGRVCFLPWVENGREIPRNELPEDELAQKLARQSVPFAPCSLRPWFIAQTIDELERLNRERLPCGRLHLAQRWAIINPGQ